MGFCTKSSSDRIRHDQPKLLESVSGGSQRTAHRLPHPHHIWPGASHGQQHQQARLRPAGDGQGADHRPERDLQGTASLRDDVRDIVPDGRVPITARYFPGRYFYVISFSSHSTEIVYCVYCIQLI
jgi:hypothetical protein